MVDVVGVESFYIMLRPSDRTSSCVPDISQTVYRILNAIDHTTMNLIYMSRSVVSEGTKDEHGKCFGPNALIDM